MFAYQPLQWLFLFYFYSFFGWCFESAYVSIMQKRLVNRGFMRGPFLPLYGSGGIMMLVVSKPYYDNILLVYIAGCIGATALEYVVGVVMEALFKVRYWDYSHKKFNFHGYICLESTLVWGFFTVVFTHYLQLPIEALVMSIPYNILTVVTVFVTVCISIDFGIAFRTALDIRDVIMYMERAKVEMARMQKRLDVIIAFKGEDAKESIEGAASAIGGSLGGLASTVGSIGSGITSRYDALASSLEKSFGTLKEKMAMDPGSYIGNVREEVTELYAKYRVLASKFTPGPVKSIYEWYRERTIAGNPTMASDEFNASLQEMKDRIRRKDSK